MEDKTVLFKIDLDTSGLKKQAELASKEVVRLKNLQSSMLEGKTKDEQLTIKNSVAYMKLNESLRQNQKALKDSTSALAINENLAEKSQLTTIEQAQAQKALAVAYNNLTQEQRENTEEGRAIAKQYADMNNALNQQSLAVNDGRRNVGLYEQSLAGLRQELKDLQNTMAVTDANSQEYIDASVRAGELRDKLKEVKENTNNLAGGTGFEKMANTFEGLKGDLANLDFEGVAEKAQTLQAVSSKMTFKEVIGGVKSMGSAFGSLGKTLLTNPLFLLVAVIGAVVDAIVYFAQEEATAEEESEKLNATIERQNAVFDRNSEVLRQNAKFKVDLAKAQGKSTKEVAQLELQALQTEEKIRRERLVKDKEQLMEKKRLYMTALREENEEVAKKLHVEIQADKQAIQSLKNGRQKYYQDRKLLLINTENQLKEEREKAKQKELDQQKEIAEKQKANYEAYKQRKQAEAQLAKEIAENIQKLTNESASQTVDNEKKALDVTYSYRQKVAELTAKDALDLKKQLLQIETEKQAESKVIADREFQLKKSLIEQEAQTEIKELKGSKEKVAEQTKLIEENKLKELQTLNIEYSKFLDESNVSLLEKEKAIADEELKIAKEASDKQADLDQKNADEKVKEEAEANEKIKANRQALADASQQLVSNLFDLQQQNIQKELESSISSNNEKLTALQQQFDNGLISSQDYEAKKLALEQKGRDEQRKIKKKQFQAEKNASLVEAGIATALGVARALPNPILATLAGVLGAAQIALIANAPIPAFIDGGKVLSGQKIGANDGKPIWRSNGDNLLATVKTGEIILNEHQQMLVGGDEVFRRAGVKGFASGGYTGGEISANVNANIENSNTLLNAIKSLPNPVVSVTDINTGQDNYATVIESATI